jgi:hypothetical protein
MQMVKKIFGSSLILLFSILIFAPKQEIYFKVEQELKKRDIVISNEKFQDNLWGLSIENADIYVKGIKVAKVKSLNLTILFLYNKLTIEGVEVDSSIGKVVPKSIENLTAIFSIMKPYKISLDAVGSFGKIHGGVYFNMNKIFLRFPETKDIISFQKFLKQDSEGLYYEKFFN